MKKINLLAVSALAMISCGAGYAATTTANFQVTATVAKACSIAATNLVFTTVTYPSSPSTGSSAVTATCTKGTPFDLGLSAGTATGASVTNRMMTGVTDNTQLLSYKLTTDSAGVNNWGNTIGTDTVHVTSATGTPTNYTVYGTIPAQTTGIVSAQNYLDTIVATLTY